MRVGEENLSFPQEIEYVKPQFPKSATVFAKALPAYLLEFAESSQWHTIHLDKIMSNHPLTNLNFYVEEPLSHTHNFTACFEKIQKSLNEESLFAFKINTAENVKIRLEAALPDWALQFYYPFHFLVRRVLPKIKGFRKIYRVLHMPIDVSKAEIIGRLIYQGFSIVAVQETNQETIFITKRHPTDNPSLSKPPSSEGVLFRMTRLGKDAKKLTIYKFRSMHPYAEYVQEYIYTHHGLDDGGKFKNDFRVSTGGRIIRKYWIDELPMLINLLKGDIKLIGVRPLSEHYFNLYPEPLKKLRIQHKPGLLPPFYADLPKNFEEIVQSEMTYLEAYQQAPLMTDLRYLIKIGKNILIKKARSK